MKLDAKTIQWAVRRKISAQTLKAMNVGGGAVQFGDQKFRQSFLATLMRAGKS